MKQRTWATMVLAMVFVLVQGSASAHASAELPRVPNSTGAPSDAPPYDPLVPAPGPADLTWEQVEVLEASATGQFAAPAVGRKNLLGTAGSSIFPGSSGVSCSINTGNVYLRASGSIYPNGAVGGKPYTQCTVIMARIEQTTDLYKTVWWGLQKVAGPFYSVNTGEARLVQTSVIRRCDDLRETTFRMIVRSTGTFPTGVRGTASAFEEAKLRCGTV